jgi:drug/metabolite transporter (DMT)-like permease
MSAALGYIFRTEQIGRIGHMGLVLAGVGTLGLAFDGLDPSRAYWLGDVLLFLAISLVAAELHLMKPLAIQYGAAATVASRTVIGGLAYMAVASPSLIAQPWLSLSGWTWVAIVAGGVIGVGVGQWIQVRALRILGPTRVVLYNNLVPLAALALAWLALGTVPSALELFAGGLIILGALCLHVFDAPVRRTMMHFKPQPEPAGDESAPPFSPS